MAYETLAGAYDRLTQDIPYEEILAFYQKIMDLYGVKPETVLDLACGTGSLSVLLAQAGYSVLGADQSVEMLTQAYEKTMLMEGNKPYFVRQKMQSLRLPVPVDCTVCCLDSINYVTNPEDCRKAFCRVYENLNPGGLLIFDINSEAKLKGLDGQMFIDEDDDVYCVWRAEFDGQTRICTYDMDIFFRQGNLWERTAEEHQEYAYTARELTEWLKEAGFTDIHIFGDRRLDVPQENEQRLFFAAKKE